MFDGKVGCSDIKSIDRKGFTLIELLVVISIIALLLSILMPSLSKVKEQARVMTCAANIRQIGLMLSMYRSSNDGSVPVVTNRWAGELPAKARFISLALRGYGTDIKRLPAGLNPNNPWNAGMVNGYFADYMPEFFACPFTRDKTPDSSEWEYGSKEISGEIFTTMRSRGRNESYTTWLWPLVRGQRYTAYPSGDDEDGRPKHGVLLWHTAVENGVQFPSVMAGYNRIKDLPMKWGKRQLRTTKAGTMADATVLSCDIGETTGTTGKLILNPDSHRKKSAGGTNVLFGDGHTGWVKGRQIGWK